MISWEKVFPCCWQSDLDRSLREGITAEGGSKLAVAFLPFLPANPPLFRPRSSIARSGESGAGGDRITSPFYSILAAAICDLDLCIKHGFFLSGVSVAAVSFSQDFSLLLTTALFGNN